MNTTQQPSPRRPWTLEGNTIERFQRVKRMIYENLENRAGEAASEEERELTTLLGYCDDLIQKRREFEALLYEVLTEYEHFHDLAGEKGHPLAKQALQTIRDIPRLFPGSMDKVKVMPLEELRALQARQVRAIATLLLITGESWTARPLHQDYPA